MPNGGKVRFRFQATDKEIATEIADSGRHSARNVSAIISGFRTYGKAGTGLGLSICKVVEDHRGWIERTG